MNNRFECFKIDKITYGYWKIKIYRRLKDPQDDTQWIDLYIEDLSKAKPQNVNEISDVLAKFIYIKRVVVTCMLNDEKTILEAR